MDDLLRYGVAVVPVFDAERRRQWEARLWAAMDTFPEYKAKGRMVQRVVGGFGALSNPSNFHAEAVRELRATLKYETAMPLFRAHPEAATMRLEMFFDRLCVRARAFKAVTAEKWHRDIYKDIDSLPESDCLFGGWVNLSPSVQTLVGLLGTHEDVAHDTGFATLTDDEIKAQRCNERLTEQADRSFGTTLHTNAKGYVLVPPGHQILFYQRLLHAVAGGVQPVEPQLRLFTGYRLTTQTASLFDHRDTLANFAVPRLPSGQVPAMFSSLHFQYFAKRDHPFHTWARDTFHEACLFQRGHYCTPGSRDDREPECNKTRSMPSLVAMGMGMAPYTDADRLVLTPEALM